MATITATELATELGTDSKTTRRFLRDHFETELHPGKGKQWAIEKRQIQSLKSRFKKWADAEATKKAARVKSIETHPEPDTAEALASEEEAALDSLDGETTEEEMEY